MQESTNYRYYVVWSWLVAVFTDVEPVIFFSQEDCGAR